MAGIHSSSVKGGISEKDPSGTALLPPPTNPPALHPPTSAVFRTLLLTNCIAVAAALALAFLFFTSPNPTPLSAPRSRPLSTLPHPVVLLVSSDGFRFGYQHKTVTPNIHRLIANGTEAETGLIPVYPTLTFPNHYSIVTGLYPAHHGIINNRFQDPVDGSEFNMGSHDPKWWGGEPLWETVVRSGLKAATYFWPGSEVVKGPWDCPPDYCRKYNGSVPFDERVDTVLGFFDLPDQDLPSFITLYFEDPDTQGHRVGPDDPEITDAVANVDRLIGKLVSGLEKRGVFDDVTLILVGDHGMVGTCDRKLVFLDDMEAWIDIPTSWVQSTTPVLALTPLSNRPAADVVAKMNEALRSGEVENGRHLTMYLKEDLPDRLHYAASDRIPPIVGLLDEGYKVEAARSAGRECGGAHGYDNQYFSMRTIFVAHGPRFGAGRKIPSFENVQIYNLVTSLLNVQGAPNNGSLSFPDRVLLPSSG